MRVVGSYWTIRYGGAKLSRREAHAECGHVGELVQVVDCLSVINQNQLACYKNNLGK